MTIDISEQMAQVILNALRNCEWASRSVAYDDGHGYEVSTRDAIEFFEELLYKRQ